MPLQDLSDPAIASVIERYRAQGKTEGGPYSLAELPMEQRRRKPSAFPTAEVAGLIVELSRQSPDGLVTYKQIWTHFRPNQQWLPNCRSRRALSGNRILCRQSPAHHNSARRADAVTPTFQ